MAASAGSDRGAATPAAQHFKVALMQVAMCASKEACTATLVKAAEQAAGQGADVLLTPEMWSVGYGKMFPRWASGNETITREVYEWVGMAEGLDGPYMSAVKSAAKRFGIAIGAGLLQADTESQGVGGGPPRNSVVLIDRHGKTVYSYSKVHTCVWVPDESMTTPGRHFFTGVLDTAHGNVTVGSMICADRESPESARLLMLHGAEVLLVPNACHLYPSQLRQFRTRAVENAVGVASESPCPLRSNPRRRAPFLMHRTNLPPPLAQ